jgi:hypothetical protein
MSLAEIEAAAAMLSPEQKEELFQFLAAQLRSGDRGRPDEPPSRKSQRGFPISRGRSSFDSDDVARVEAEADRVG